jgi:hypothetical protein
MIGKVPFKRNKLTVMVSIAIAMMVYGCGTINTVADVFASVDKLNAECQAGVVKLSAKGINVVTVEDCAKSAAASKDKLTEVLGKVRAELNKAGI